MINPREFRERPVQKALNTLFALPLVALGLLAEATGLKKLLRRKDHRFFEKAGPILSDFARRHNLTLEEWYKESSAWSLVVDRLPNGKGTVQVQRFQEGIALVAAIWTRIKPKPEFFPIGPSYVPIAQLDEKLTEILQELLKHADEAKS